jgi:hypothetical protein
MEAQLFQSPMTHRSLSRLQSLMHQPVLAQQQVAADLQLLVGLRRQPMVDQQLRITQLRQT